MKRGNDMNYFELRQEERDELRETLFYGCEQCCEYDYLSEEEKTIVQNANCPADITDDVMISAFGGYDFVEEDFFCNLKPHNSEGE